MRETLGFHPLANVFPLIEGVAFDEFVADVKAHGIRRPVWLFEGLILDGRNRYRAAEKADIDHVPLETFEGTYAEALAFIISENLQRRHLTDGQRQYVAAKISTLTPGRPSDETPPIGGVSVADAARMLNVKPRSVERAKQVQRDATAALAAAVERGLLAVDLASQASKLSIDIQEEVAREAEGGKLKNLRTILKRAARTAREKELGAKQRGLPDKKYGVILADPEWEFVVFSKVTGLDRAADNHYPTSSEKEIAARDVQKIAAKDCLLLLWVTDLARGIRVMESWGFEYKSYFVWVKDIVEWTPTPEQEKTGLGGKGRLLIEIGAAGTGFWNRDRDELLLIGTRGSVPAPSMGTQGESVIFAPRPKTDEASRGKHSAKPDFAHEWVEEHFPNLPKIELNARSARRGWDTWGNEAPETPHDPLTGEVLEDLPPPRPERSSLMPELVRVQRLADANGMVTIGDGRVVAAGFVTAGELAQAEAYEARQQQTQQEPIDGDSQRDEERPSGDEGDTGGGDHEDQRGDDFAAGERSEQEGDCHPASGGDEAVTAGHHNGLGRAAAAEGLVLPVEPAPPGMEIPPFRIRKNTDQEISE